MLDGRDRKLLIALRDLGGRMVRPSSLRDRLKWDWKELYKHIHHCERADFLRKAVIEVRGLVGYRLISPDERRATIERLVESFVRAARSPNDRRVLDSFNRLGRELIVPPRRRRGRPRRPFVERGVGISPTPDGPLLAAEDLAEAEDS